VVITQPRRLAAKSLARRVARALGTSVGERVGYRIGQEQLCSEDTEILFVTAGYLIQV
jgi:HrpA-like RNA helicase